MPIDTNQRLSDHFTLAEFLKSDTATRRGTWNKRRGYRWGSL